MPATTIHATDNHILRLYPITVHRRYGFPKRHNTISAALRNFALSCRYRHEIVSNNNTVSIRFASTYPKASDYHKYYRQSISPFFGWIFAIRPFVLPPLENRITQKGDLELDMSCENSFVEDWRTWR
jgi:hypothetical protein